MNVSTMDEYFTLFISDDIDIIIRCTNKKGKEVHDAMGKPWKPVDSVEIRTFFGFHC